MLCYVASPSPGSLLFIAQYLSQLHAISYDADCTKLYIYNDAIESNSNNLLIYIDAIDLVS